MKPGAKFLVIGAGRTGQAAAEILCARGARVYVTDEQSPPALRQAVATIESYGAQFVPPDRLATLLPDLDRAILSPGVPLGGALAQRVGERVPVVSEIEVAYELCKAPIIAVTGTKGKSTTTALIAHLLRCAGKSVRVGGNIGNPLIREADAASSEDWVVAEVSSFQLETIRSFKPRIAVILNVSDDHLDRYASLDEYTQAKYRVFENQTEGDTFIGNLDDPRVRTIADRVTARTLWFSSDAREAHATLFAAEDGIWYRLPHAPERRLTERSDIALPGAHNVQNLMAAMLAGLAAGLDADRLRAGVKTFQPMEHRLQTVAEIGGVTFVDDSKATNPAAVIAGLHAFDRPIVLIAGGRSKGADFAPLGAAISARVKTLILVGEAADAIARATDGPAIVRAATLDDAVGAARNAARAGDVVLLSPGCASFDMFESAEQRGERFATAVLRAVEGGSVREAAGA